MDVTPRSPETADAATAPGTATSLGAAGVATGAAGAGFAALSCWWADSDALPGDRTAHHRLATTSTRPAATGQQRPPLRRLRDNKGMESGFTAGSCLVIGH